MSVRKVITKLLDKVKVIYRLSNTTSDNVYYLDSHETRNKGPALTEIGAKSKKQDDCVEDTLFTTPQELRLIFMSR